MRAAASAASAGLCSRSLPSMTGTPALFIVRRAASLSPIRRMVSGDGPMKVSPHFPHSSANAAFSDSSP